MRPPTTRVNRTPGGGRHSEHRHIRRRESVARGRGKAEGAPRAPFRKRPVCTVAGQLVDGTRGVGASRGVAGWSPSRGRNARPRQIVCTQRSVCSLVVTKVVR
ncbi:hypothetical protein GCM10027174_42590 [Salinifilum aidingensis]